METMPSLEEIKVEEVESEEDPYSLWDSCRREPEPEMFFKRNRRLEKSSTLKNKIRDKRKYLLYSDVNRNKYVETYRGVFTETSEESSYETMLISYFKKEFMAGKTKIFNKNYFAKKFGDHIHLYDLETKKFFKSFTCNYLNHTLYDNRCCTYGEYVKKVRDLGTVNVPSQTTELFQSILRKKMGHNKFFFGKPAVASRDFWDGKVFVKGVSIPVIKKRYKRYEKYYSRASYKKEVINESNAFLNDLLIEKEEGYIEVYDEDPYYDDFIKWEEEDQNRILNPLEYDYDDYNYLEDLCDDLFDYDDDPKDILFDNDDFFFDDHDMM